MKLKNKVIAIAVIVLMIPIIGFGIYQLSSRVAEPVETLAGNNITTQNWENLVGVMSEVTQGSLTTTTAKTTGDYTSYYKNTREIGQFDISCNFTPYEAGTEIHMNFYSGSIVNGECDNSTILWAKDGIESIGSASSTVQGYVEVWAKDEGVAFTASTTESITINRDWSNECARIDIKEFGVSSAQGDLICQAIKTN